MNCNPPRQNRMSQLMAALSQEFIAETISPLVLRQNHAVTITLSQQNGGSPITVTEISPALAQLPAFAEQFEPIMEAAAQVSHPALLPILDFGFRGEAAYVVNPYVTRGALAGEIHMSGRLLLIRMVDVLAQLADAIDAIHSHEMVHCGLTAGVVLRGMENSIILGNLGLADLMYQAAGVTPEMLPYAAPEPLIKAPYTVRVDIYALGILAYEMLAGQIPFSGTTNIQYMQAHLRYPLPPIGAQRSDVPDQVYGVLKRATGKLAHSRYWTAREMARDLAQVAGVPVDIPTPRPVRSLSHMITRYRSLRSAPVKQRGNLKVSQMYAEALLREQQSPSEARQMYHQILEIWPRMAQGDVLDRLMGLEQRMFAQNTQAIRARAQQALNRGDWPLLLRAGQELMWVDPEDREAEQMRQVASIMLAAEEQYRTACLAEMLGDTPAAMQLTQELFKAVPNFSDSEGLTLIEPHRAAHIRETATAKLHESNILALEFTTAGRLVASGATDKNVRIAWLPRLEASASLETFHSWVCALGFSPDGEYLLTGLWDGEIRLWRLPDGEYHGMIAGLVNQIQGMAFVHHQPDLVAVAPGSFLTLWRVSSGERLATLRETDLNSISSLAFARQTPRLVCGMTHGSLRVRDAAQPGYPVIADIPVHRVAVHGLVYLADRDRVASISHYDTATITDIARGEVLFELRGHEDAVLSIACSPTEPLIVTGGTDATVRLWDADRGRPLAILPGHRRAVSRVAVSPDSRLIASADSGGTIRLWRTA